MLQIKAVISMVSGFRSSDFERKLQSDYRLLVFIGFGGLPDWVLRMENPDYQTTVSQNKGSKN